MGKKDRERPLSKFSIWFTGAAHSIEMSFGPVVWFAYSIHLSNGEGRENPFFLNCEYSLSPSLLVEGQVGDRTHYLFSLRTHFVLTLS